MTIRNKLYVGFGLFICLATAFSIFAYKELFSITLKLHLVETVDNIDNTILEVRRYEKNFLLYKDQTSINELKGYLDTLKRNSGASQEEIINEIGRGRYELMFHSIKEYEDFLDKVISNYKSQSEQLTALRDEGRAVERRLTGGMLGKFLVIRRYEKNLLLYKDKKTFQVFEKAFINAGLNGIAVKYHEHALRLYELFRHEAFCIDKMRLKAREVQSLTEALSRNTREHIDRTVKMTMRLLLAGLLTVVILGSLVNRELVRSISGPIRKLQEMTKNVAMGDFSKSIEVKGNDELASLECSFNDMETKLKESVNSLELTIKRLHEKQAQLVEAEKRASIGTLAAGIAHEINNPLTSVLTFSNLMLEQTPEDDPRRGRLQMIAKETARASNIVRQLLSFARETPVTLVKSDVNQPVREIIDSLIARDAFKDIELTTDLSGDLPDISADAERLGQVVLNMMLNALHAITPPGKIHVLTRLKDGFVEILFSDTGCGIPEENIGKIFDPFFTTRDAIKGAGLGLAVSYGIIKQHSGEIDVESTVGKGSTFIVRLPVNG
ncbi:MAG: HAMP domain-containing protein [Nitrospirae bacterium]|nr:HAMP domain-containing protein [Nitrospirota bacterium]